MKESSYTLASKAIDGLRRTALANEQTKGKISKALKISRPTLNRHYEQGDMPLSEFLALAATVGKKPSEAISMADVLVTKTDDGGE